MILFIKNILLSAIHILNGASVWLVISFILAGLLHEFLEPSKFQRMLGNKKMSSILKATLSGMLLPICSCGVIPLGLSMYYSGAYLGPTLAFMTATPIINPIAVILCFGLLGSKIGIIYLLCGFLLPVIIGFLGNQFSGDELSMGIELEVSQGQLDLETEKLSILQRISSGIHWVLNDMGMVVSKYVILGMIGAGFLLTVFPSDIIGHYLGNPGMLSLGSVAVMAGIMYVCAVGHIPFIAALIASGAAPGVGIVFLMAGTATNLPELISIYKIIGRRAVILYSGTITLSAFVVGFLTNQYLMPGFEPAINFNQTTHTIEIANKLLFVAPNFMKYMCSVIIFLLFIKAVQPEILQKIEALKSRLKLRSTV